MTTLQQAAEIARRDQYLAVVSTLRSDGTIQSSVVNAGVLPHPIGGAEVIGFVTYGPTEIGEPPTTTDPHHHVSLRVGVGHSRRDGRPDRAE